MKIPNKDDDDALGTGNVVGYLAQRGIPVEVGATALNLGGGVSNIVLAIGEGPGALVVKQALPRLRVDDEWRAPTERALAEVDALDLVHMLTPGAVPRVVDRDFDRCTLVIERAPNHWENWRSLLLSGTVDPEIGTRLGSLLSSWHNATFYGHSLSQRFYEVEPFEALRVEPYYRTVAERLPQMSRSVLGYADEMLARRLCLVHGDFSPKNVLVGPSPDLWVIDFEVAHLGDPAFDVAFLLCHLLLKSVHRPELAWAYDHCAARFCSAYEAGVRAELSPPWEYALGHVGCLLLARVAGKSPVEYLTADDRSLVVRLGGLLVSAPPARPECLGEARRRASK